jgi:surface carbohydrate biosynthesis protein
VHYSNGYGIERKLVAFKPDALILDHLAWNFKVDQARLAKKCGAKVILLPTEGFFQSKEPAQHVAGSLHNAIGIPDLVLHWGKYQQSAVFETGEALPDRHPVVGCMRWDFYREPYLSLAPSRSAFLRSLGFSNPHAPLILWATNTTYTHRKPRDIMRRYIKKAGWTREMVNHLLEDEKTQFREHTRFVSELARLKPEWNFVVKIHPAESICNYQDLEAKFPNIKLAFDAPIRDFLIHADVLIQKGCTTATEFWMLGKPVIEINVGQYHRSARSEFLSGNHPITDTNSAVKAISAYLKGTAISPDRLKSRNAFLEEFYFKIDGKSAFRIAERINAEISPPIYTDSDMARTASAWVAEEKSRREFEDKRLVNKFKDLIGLDRGRTLRFWKKWNRAGEQGTPGLFVAEKEIGEKEVAPLYSRYADLLGLKRALAVDESGLDSEAPLLSQRSK